MSDDLRSLDARIDHDVFGHDVLGYVIDGRDAPVPDHVPRYSTDDAAALQALDRLCADNRLLYKIDSSRTGPSFDEATVEHDTKLFWAGQKERIWSGWQPTRPLAIVRAILAFLDLQKEQGNGQ